MDVLHTIGGDDTNTTAADLAAYLHEHGYELTVVGLPKTIDNDVVPIRQSLGAWTAAEQGALFARNVVAEHSSNPRMLIVHEVMGRRLRLADRRDRRRTTAGCSSRSSPAGWRTTPRALGHPRRLRAGAALRHRRRGRAAASGDGRVRRRQPLPVRGRRRRRRSSPSMEAPGEEVPRDPFGHVKLDKVNPGAWFAKQFAERLGRREDAGAEVRVLLPLGRRPTTPTSR